MSSKRKIADNSVLLASTESFHRVQELEARTDITNSFKIARRIGVSPRDLLLNAVRMAMLERVLDSAFSVNGTEITLIAHRDEDNDDDDPETQIPMYTACSTSQALSHINTLCKGRKPIFDISLYTGYKRLECRGELTVDLSTPDLLETMRYCSGEMETHTEDLCELIEACQSL